MEVGEVYNVGSDAMNYSKQAVCEMIQAQVPGCYVHYADVGTDADKRDYKVSYKKINALGYNTTISLENGIAELIRGLMALDFKNRYSNA